MTIVVYPIVAGRDERIYLQDGEQTVGVVRVSLQEDGNAQFSELECSGAEYGAAMLIQRAIAVARSMGASYGVFWTENSSLARTISGTKIFRRAVFEVKV